MIFRGYRHQQSGGPVLVTVTNDSGEESVLSMPELSKAEFRHSPDGFQMGYAGSGPAELARAILVRVFPDDDRARHPRCYQKFKAAVIAGFRDEEFQLSEEEVRAWFRGWERENSVERGWLTEWADP